MIRSCLFACVAGAALLVAAPRRAESAAPKPAPPSKPKVEVVFCLDTTGSMTKLIDGAKAKIWAICNQIAGGTPTPDLKVGLVAYRDKGDAYVTKVFDLSDDLDAIHGHLKGFEARGGGDIPESVNQALDDAVNKISWSKDKKTLKIIFLVGDAPPHMDYTDDMKYPDTCKKAVEKDLIINTIQCGDHPECTKHWKEIARRAEGVYVSIAQSGGVAKAIETPHDKRLAEINRELSDCALVYGSARQQKDGEKKKAAAKGLKGDAAADRASYFGKSGRAMSYSLLQAIDEKKVELSKMKEEELPPELRKLKTLKEREEYVKKLRDKQTALNKEAAELDRKRLAYIKKEQQKKGDKGKDGFDEQVLQTLRKQARKQNIKY